MWTAIISAIVVIVQACTSLADSAIQQGHAALTARRQLIAANLNEFFKMNTQNYKDVILAAMALIGIFGIFYLSQHKK